MTKGRLYLVPSTIADNTQSLVIPPQVRNVLLQIGHFLAEDVRTARRYLSSLQIFPSIEALDFQTLNKDTPLSHLRTLFAPVFGGNDMGVVSDAGCPGVADPGASAVKFAHDHEIQVIPLVGPSSILLALMASGLNGQQFAFHGYMPIERVEFQKRIKELEKESRKNAQTQIFIETPYRSDSTFKSLLQVLRPDTLLSVAANLTAASEMTFTCSVMQWKGRAVTLGKVPVVFSLLGI